MHGRAHKTSVQVY